MRQSIKNESAPAFETFEEKLDKLEEASDYSGILDYLLSLKTDLVHL